MGPRCPEHLKEAARREWRRVVRSLGDRLEATDRGVLLAYCHTFAEAVELQQQVAKAGRLATTPQGHIQTSPLWTQLRQASELLLKLATALGLHPQARGDVRGRRRKRKKREPADVLAGLTFKRGQGLCASRN